MANNENNPVVNEKVSSKNLVSMIALIVVGVFAMVLGALFLVDNGSGKTIFALSEGSFLPLNAVKLIAYILIIVGALLVLIKAWSPSNVKKIVYTKKKVKVEEDGKPAKTGVLAILSKEYKYENLILAFLAVFAIVLGALLLTGNDGEPVLTISEDFPVLGDFPKLFAWILVGLGVVSVLLVAWPFYRPSIAEIKHLKGDKRADFFLNVVRVMVFSLVFCGILVLFDFVIQWVPTWFN